ncbi:hypothetical protein RhiirB3_429567 [Rhizophagus irregularis]|nr:hypothetical protein RhiirB3_429567 [Rhizophagus irregularis]
MTIFRREKFRSGNMYLNGDLQNPELPSDPTNVSINDFNLTIIHPYSKSKPRNNIDIDTKIDKLNITDNLAFSDEFKLMLRGSRDGCYYGPYFGSYDFALYGNDFYNESYCRKSAYEDPIRKTEDTSSIEEYEVFQIIKN